VPPVRPASRRHGRAIAIKAAAGPWSIAANSRFAAVTPHRRPQSWDWRCQLRAPAPPRLLRRRKDGVRSGHSPLPATSGCPATSPHAHLWAPLGGAAGPGARLHPRVDRATRIRRLTDFHTLAGPPEHWQDAITGKGEVETAGSAQKSRRPLKWAATSGRVSWYKAIRWPPGVRNEQHGP
jgi:hypothetical protein